MTSPSTAKRSVSGTKSGGLEELPKGSLRLFTVKLFEVFELVVYGNTRCFNYEPDFGGEKALCASQLKINTMLLYCTE